MRNSQYLSALCLISSTLYGCSTVLGLPDAYKESTSNGGENNGGASATGGTKAKGGTSSKATSTNPGSTSKGGTSSKSATGGTSSTGGNAGSGGDTTHTSSSETGGTLSVGGTSTTGGTSSTIVGAPVITSFTVDYNKVCSGNAATLKAVFSNGTGTVSGGVGDVTSGVDKTTGAIAADTTYTLTVTNSKGAKVESTVSVTALKNAAFTPTGAMSASKYYSSLIPLENGKPLIMANGDSGSCNIEQYDLNTGVFAVTGKQSPCHMGDTMTSLGNGTVLIAAGSYFASSTTGANGSETLNADIYDPGSDKTTATAPLSVNRDEAHAIYLPTNGRVLIVGGDCCGDTTTMDTAELFIPTQGTNGAFSLVTMQAKRFYNATTLLSDGRVLITGGAPWEEGGTATAEVYDPLDGSSGTFTLVNSMNSVRSYHAAALLPNGKVLIAGGYGASGRLSSAEIFDPETLKFTATGSLNAPRSGQIMIPLRNGRVLVFGGSDEAGNWQPNIEMYNPATGKFTYPTSANTDIKGNAVLLQNGAVLVAGTNTAGAPSAALYCP